MLLSQKAILKVSHKEVSQKCFVSSRKAEFEENCEKSGGEGKWRVFADGPINRRKNVSYGTQSVRKRCESKVRLPVQWNVLKFAGKVPDPGRKSWLNLSGEVTSLGWLLCCRFPVVTNTRSGSVFVNTNIMIVRRGVLL